MAQFPAFSLDSLRLEKEGDRFMVIHQVEQGETLFGLSKRYGASIDDIKSANQGLAAGLAANSLIKIPVIYVDNSIPSHEKDRHEVKHGETLYAISRRYSIPVDQIKTWNNLVNNEISIGQRLFVKPPPTTAPVINTPTEIAENQDSTKIKSKGRSKAKPATNDVQTNELKVTTANVEDKETEVQLKPETTMIKGDGRRQTDITALIDTTHDDEPEPYSPVSKANMTQNRRTDFKKMNENGLAEVIPDNNETQKYLALHRTAPAGTIIQVENEMNNTVVFVRVIGKLPDTGPNDKLVIKLSKKAYQALGAIDKRFPVNISYIP